MPTIPLDLSWFRAHLLDDILPHWLTAALTDSGLLWPSLDRQWRRSGTGEGTLVSQGRLVYNFATGYALTGEQAYADAVARGAEFLMTVMRDPRWGGWWFSCAPDGTVLDDRKDSYGHAFVVFGLSHAAACLGDDRCRRAALDAWDTLNGPLRDVHGGLTPALTADFSAPAGRAINSQNPMMHCFEALLALGDLPGLGHIHVCARELADFLLSRRSPAIGNALAEMYTDDWQPLPTSGRGRVDIGHQFEWAFLLSSAAERGFGERYVRAGRELLDYGLRVGYDAEEGGVHADASLEGGVIRPDKGWWQQCEAVRAMLHYALVRGREDLWEPLQGMMRFILREMVDPEYGGWYAGPGLEKGNVWKIDYHVVGMCAEAIRLQGPIEESR